MSEFSSKNPDEISNQENSIGNQYIFKKGIDVSHVPTDSESQVLKIKEEEMNKTDQAKIAEIRTTLGLEHKNDNELQKYLKDYLELKENDVEKIDLLKAENLPENYKMQLNYLKDDRLINVTVAVVPDELWAKGNQPSESHAENQMILIKESYYKSKEKPDEIAWMLHEFAHCQNFLDSKSEEDYKNNMQKYAFDDLKTEYTYPNNPVEKITFTKQFQFLKDSGKSREDVLKMINKYYQEEDIPFFNRLLDNVYGK